MTYEQIEESTDSGQPLELLRVSYLTNEWCFTTAEIPISHDGLSYLPMPFKHDEPRPTGDISRASINISVPQDCPVGELFRIRPPSGVVTATILGKHLAEPDQVTTIWKGRIVNVDWQQPWLVLTVESVYSSLRRMGIRRKFSPGCPHPLYSMGEGLCNADRANFVRNYTASAVSGLTVTCSGSEADTYFAGGYVEWTHATAGYQEQRMVTESFADGRIVLVSPPLGLVPGQPIKVYPGCDHLSATCKAKFNNALNYGGFEFAPTKNPFDGSAMY
jgi:uncharacterized phage protein (TIGR02218 family)